MLALWRGGSLPLHFKAEHLCPSSIGIDIVETILELNRERFGNSQTRFIQADVTSLDSLPDIPRGIIFSRQMMQHM